jgi:hypothetical protein
METEHAAIAACLRRLDAIAADDPAPFDYDGLLTRHAARATRERRRYRIARASAGALVVALVGASVWRLEPARPGPAVAAAPTQAPRAAAAQPHIVRADTYLALAALEDHIARLDDAISEARVYAPRGAEVARLESTRNELLDSYAQVRYAELVSANF